MPDSEKPLRILFSLPCYGGLIYDHFFTSWNKLMRWCNENHIASSLQVISNESLLPRARNMGIKKLLDHTEIFTHIMFMDVDMGFEPLRLERLLAFDKDVVGCPGPCKWIHWEKVHEAILEGRDPQMHSLRYAVNFLNEPGARGFQAESGFAKVKDFGLCFCLVKTEVVQKMVQAYPETKCDQMVYTNGEDAGGENVYALFDTTVCPDEGRYLECDHAFLARWRRLGGEVWADMTGDLIHCGTYQFRGSMAEYFFNTPYHGTKFLAETTPWGILPPDEKDAA